MKAIIYLITNVLNCECLIQYASMLVTIMMTIIIFILFFFSFSSILQNNDISVERITKNPSCDEQIFPSTKFPRQGDLVHLLLHLP